MGHNGPRLPSYVMGYIPPGIMDRYARESEAIAGRAKAAFTSATDASAADAKGVRHEWRQVEGLPNDNVAFHAHYSDLAVIGQPAPVDERAPGTDGLPDELVLAAGRPILTVPHAGRFAEIGQRILLAWNGSREAARAVQDALPLLKQADEVAIFGVNMPSAAHIPGGVTRHILQHMTVPTLMSR